MSHCNKTTQTYLPLRKRQPAVVVFEEWTMIMECVGEPPGAVSGLQVHVSYSYKTLIGVHEMHGRMHPNCICTHMI